MRGDSLKVILRELFPASSLSQSLSSGINLAMCMSASLNSCSVNWGPAEDYGHVVSPHSGRDSIVVWDSPHWLGQNPESESAAEAGPCPLSGGGMWVL